MSQGLRVLTTVKPAPKAPRKPRTEIADERPMSYFARKWHVSVPTVYRYTQLKDDPLPSHKIIGARRIEIKAAMAWWKRRNSQGVNR